MLSDETINKIISTQVAFQGNEKTLGDLVGGRNGLSEMLDSSSVEEILFHRNKVDIPSFKPHEFEKSLWIERFLLPPPITFDEDFLHELTKELGYTRDKLDKSCKFNPRTNRIKWLIDDTDKTSNIWTKMEKLLLKKKESPDTIPDSETPMTCGSIPEIKLATGSELKSCFIITGVAGSGKSTALSRHYEHVKTANSNVWVITINLIKHSKYLSKLAIKTASDAVDFLVNFPGVTGDGAFARSLLRNRLINTGGVVLMLDGFDEINDQCKDTIIRLIKAISNGKTKLDRLLITTRPHLAKSLQDELFQFAFSLENLGKVHQVEYLMKYWQNNMTLSKEEIARKFANDLIDRVTEALKDKERSFIGIPLQCRILAECFQPKIESHSAPEIGSNYNVAQLYHMLFQKKRDIFQNKKATGSTDFDLMVKWALDEFLQTIDSYHFKLAIDTIFEEKYANLLWPPQQLSDRQSDEDRKEEKMRRYALQFGLTSVDTQNTRKLQFLHRTFAEYLVAEFLYKGILSDDNKHKDQIRDSDGPLRDFVIRHIFVENAYEGVRIFLDSMLKDMAITNQIWRDTIPTSINESQPNQLQRFAHHFSFSMSDFLSSGSGAEAFLKTIQEGNVGIFDFMLDCLGAIYDRHSVQEMVTKAIDIGVSHLFFSRSVEIHQRIVNFFSDAELKTVNVLLNLMVEHFPFARAECYSNFPPKARKTYLAFLLDFMEKHQKNLANLLNLEFLSFYLLEPKGHFIFDPYYDEELRRFIKLVITNRYTTPSSVNYFEENLDYGGKAMAGRNENWVNGSIEKILTILKDLQQDKMLEKMSRAVLTSNPNLYQRFYRPCIFEKDRISELRESALKGDKHAISETKWQLLAAATVGNEDVCENMLRILSTNQDWTQLTELIENALRIATTQSADMWTLIVRVVRRHFDRQSNSGKETLRHILTWLFDVMQGPLIESFDRDILHEVVQMKVTEEEDGADWFREILLGSTDSPTQMAKHYEEGFSLLLKHVLDYFNQQQLVKFIRLITSQDYKIEFEGVGCSIWAAEIARTEGYIDRNWSANCYRFLELVTSRLDQESVINLLKHQEDNVIVLYHTALTHGQENFVSKMCSHYLLPENRDTVISDFYEKAPYIILDLFDRYSREMLPYQTKITDLISFFVDHATDDQLLRLVDIITSRVSYWEYLFDHLSNEDVLKILTRASKLPVGFEDVVRKLLLIDDIRGHGAIIIRAAQQRGDDFIQTVCALLPEISQIEIANFLKRHATQRIKEIFFSEELHWFWVCDSEIRWNALNFFLNHGNDDQRSEMVNVLTTLRHVDERVCSIWNRCIEELANTKEFSGKDCPRAQVCRKLDTFLEKVNEKIGGDAVIKLLLHKEGQENKSEVVLIRIALLYLGTLSNDPYECTSRFTIKDTVLSQEKQVELGQLLEPAINQFKQEKCDVNSPFCTSHSYSDHWTRALHFYLDYSTDPNLSANFFHIMTYKRPRWKQTETSIWEYFFGFFPEEVRECFHLLRHVSEKLGEDVVKKLALEKDGKGRFLLGEALKKHGHDYSVKSMYAFLSTQARNEVFHTLLDDPYVSSKLDVEIGSHCFSENTNGELLMYLELVKSVRQIDGKSRSIWTNYVGKIELNTEKFERLLKLVLDKLGEEYLKQLILHDDDGDGESIISLATSQEHFSKIDAIFSFLSPASKTEVRQKGYTATGLIERMVSNKGSDYWIIRHLKINSADGTASNLPGGFDVLASYFLDKFNLDQLKSFVKLITSLNKVKRETRSIWGDYIRKVCSIRPFTKQEEENQKFSLSSIEHFFKVVSNRLGTTAVVQLLYHYDSSCVVINYFVLKDCPEIANLAFCQLEQHEKNGKIRFCPINGRPIVEQPIEPSLHQQQRGKKKRDRRANK
jgi:hypothetical protein